MIREHGIQSRLGGIQYVLDAGFRRHDRRNGTFRDYDTLSFAGMTALIEFSAITT
ncbi:MAG TPA: hypothetical protein PK874_05985 [Desulfobacteraceae bacterium]|nr:hypothetical protein [Desulfobacteraceae bacterium]